MTAAHFGGLRKVGAPQGRVLACASRGDSQESATENRPPARVRLSSVRVKRCGKSAPAFRVTGVARQTPPEARPRRPHLVRPRRRPRAARPSLRVGRLRHPATVCPDGWSPPHRRDHSRWCGTESGLQANSSALCLAYSATRGRRRPQRIRAPSQSSERDLRAGLPSHVGGTHQTQTVRRLSNAVTLIDACRADLTNTDQRHGLNPLARAVERDTGERLAARAASIDVSACAVTRCAEHCVVVDAGHIVGGGDWSGAQGNG